MSPSRQKELADFLRSRRHRLSPGMVGLQAAGRRLTPGLRREEVAQLAGIGVDWYVRLEQGRAITPSASTIESLGRALRLNDTELRHLRALSQAPTRTRFLAEVVPEVVRRVVESHPHPAYVTGRRWDVLAWNAAAEDLFAFGRLAVGDRNTLLIVLTMQRARRMFGARWQDEARRMVAQFRATHDLSDDDPAFQELFNRLRSGCPEFEGWWKTHDVRSASAGRKIMQHPDNGPLDLEYATFQTNDDPSLKMVMYAPPAEALDHR